MQSPVDGDDLTGAHEQQVADDDVAHRDLGDPTLNAPPGGAGCALDQEAQLSLRSRRGPGLQKLPAGEHHRDHGASERLVDGDGASQCEHRDDVDAQLAPADRAGGPPDREGQTQDAPGHPQIACRCLRRQQRRHPSGEQQQGGSEEEQGFLAFTQAGHGVIVRLSAAA